MSGSSRDVPGGDEPDPTARHPSRTSTLPDGSAPFEARLRSELSPDLDVVRLIGRGQMSSVYLAREVALRRPVAVKLLRPELAADNVARARFEREAQSAARITHPNVAAVHRVGRLHDGVPYLVMEYVDGRNLEDALVAEGALDERTTRRLLAQLGDALAAAHAQDVVHRDVRPANVLLERAGDRVVLTDFGLAAVAVSGAEAVTRLTRDGEQIGDRRYMSPEQLLGQPVTAETDVYSLGIIGYEAFTGAHPYRTEGLSDPVTARLRQAPLALSGLRADAPADLEGLLLRCLAMQPERRPRASEISRILLDARPSRGIHPPAARRARGGNALGNFIDELKHRRVLGEALAYLALAFAVLQGAQLAFPALGLSQRTFNALVLVVLAGFPVFIAFAWAYDLRRGRAVATHDDDDPAGMRARRAWLPQALVLVLSLVVVVMLGWWYLR